MAGAWSSALRSAGNSQRIGGGRRGSLSDGYDPAGNLGADYSGVERWAGAIRRLTQATAEARDLEERRQADEMEAAAARAAAQDRADREKVQGQIAESQAEQRKVVADAIAKEQANAPGEIARKEANIRARVDEYDRDTREGKRKHDQAHQQRVDDWQGRQEDRAADQATNRQREALEQAQKKADAMEQRLALHKKQQDLAAEKERSAGLAKSGRAGKKAQKTAAKAEAQGMPAPATYDPLVLSPEDEEIAAAVRGGQATKAAWVQAHAQKLISQNPAPVHTSRPPVERPYEGPDPNRTLRGYRAGMLDWARDGAAAPEGSRLPGDAAAAPPPAAAPQPPRAASGRIGPVAPSVRDAGFGAGSAPPPSPTASRPASAPRPAAPRPAAQPAAPASAPALPSLSAPAARPAAPGGAPSPVMPFKRPQQGQITGLYGGGSIVEQVGGDDPKAWTAQVNDAAERIARQANPKAAEAFLRVKQTELWGPKQAALLSGARQVMRNQLEKGTSPGAAAGAAQAFVRQRLESEGVAAKAASADWSGLLSPTPQAIASFVARMGPPIIVGILTQGAALPTMAAGLVGSIAGQELADPGATMGTLRSIADMKAPVGPALSPTETIVDTLGAAIPATGAAEKTAARLGGGKLARVAGGSAEGAIQGGGTEAVTQAITEGQVDPGSVASATVAGAGLGGGLHYAVEGIVQNVRDRKLAASMRAEAARLNGAGGTDEQVLAQLAEMAKADDAAAGEQPRVRQDQNHTPHALQPEDVPTLFPRAKTEDLGGGRVRVTGQGLEKPIDVEVGKREVKLGENTMRETRGAEMQPGEYVAGRFSPEGEAAKLETRAGEGRETGMHEVTHAVEKLTEQGILAKEDRAALDAQARWLAADEASRRGVKVTPALLAEARADLVGRYSATKGAARVADTPWKRAAAKVGDFVRELRLGATAENAAERIRTGDTTESMTTEGGRRLRRAWDQADALVNPLERDAAALERAREDAAYRQVAGDSTSAASGEQAAVASHGGAIGYDTQGRPEKSLDEMLAYAHNLANGAKKVGQRGQREGTLGVAVYASEDPKTLGTYTRIGGGKAVHFYVPDDRILTVDMVKRNPELAAKLRIANPRDIGKIVMEAGFDAFRSGKELAIYSTRGGARALTLEEYGNVERMIPREDAAAGRAAGDKLFSSEEVDGLVSKIGSGEEQARIRKRSAEEGPIDTVALRSGEAAAPNSRSIDDVKKIVGANRSLVGLREEEQVRRMVDQGVREVEHQRKQPRSGKGWYSDDIHELEANVRKMFPSTADPEKMKVFKLIAAATSFGNRPNPNLEIATQVFRGLERDGKLPLVQEAIKDTGEPVRWSGAPSFDLTAAKLDGLVKTLGGLDKLSSWMQEKHPVSTLKMYNKNVSGKANDLKYGSEVLGPKGSAFFQNLTGNHSELTADMWFSRTFNRWRGTGIEDAPRSDAERALMRRTVDEIAKRTGETPADVQAMLWFHEKDLYGKLGAGDDFGSYAVAARRARESMAARPADGPLVQPSPLKPSEASAAFEVKFGSDSPFGRKYDWASLSPEQAKRVTMLHGRYLVDAVEAATGARVVRETPGSGAWGEGTNPNWIIRLNGTREQVSAAAHLLGLGAQQDAVVLSRPVSEGGDQGLEVSNRGGRDYAEPGFLEEVWARYGKLVPDLINDGGASLDTAANGKSTIRLFGPALADKGNLMRAQAAISDAIRWVDTGAKPLAGARMFETEWATNNWKESPNGEGYRAALEERGHTRESLERFHEGSARALDEAWRAAGARSPEAPAEVAAGEKASVRYSSLPEKGLPEERAARQAGDLEKEGSIRQGRDLRAEGSDLYRRATGRTIDRVREIKTPDGKKVGEFIAEQMEAADRYGVEKSSQASAVFDKAYGAFERVTRAAGGDVDASWRRVVDVLDRKLDPNGKPVLTYKDLTGPEQNLYAVTKSIFNNVKRDAIANGVFTGQQISNYWPHMREGAPLEYDALVDSHAAWLQTPAGKDRLKALTERDADWLAGVVGQPSIRELAAMDLAKNWSNDAWLTKHPHLEKVRTGGMTDYSTSPDVVRKYLRTAYPRIGEGRFVGPKAELVRTAVGQLSTKDRAFVTDAFKAQFGRKDPGYLGTAGDKLVREVNYIQGMSKLTNAAIAQIAQPAAAMGHTVGRVGVKGGLRAILKATDQTVRRWKVAAEDAHRSGATFAADSDEALNALSSAGSYTQHFLLNTLKLEKLPVVREAIKTSWFVKELDARARVYADAMGRFAYIEALRSKNVKALEEMLGGGAVGKAAAAKAIAEDAPHWKALQDTITSGRSGDVAILGGQRMGRPVASGFEARPGVERMDRAGRYVADKTQFRNRAMDQPMAWQSPAVKALNPFMSFPLQHYYWQKGEIAGLAKALKAGDKEAAKVHARTLLAFNAIFAPVLGYTAMNLRAITQGKGPDSKQIDPTSHPFLQLMEALGPDPIASDNEGKWVPALQAIQAWNFAGGAGYPLSFVERGARSFISERAGGDLGRALASGIGGAHASTAYDFGAAGNKALTLLLKWSEGKASKREYEDAKRALVNLTAHVPGLNLPFGLSSQMRSRVNSRGKASTMPGWAGLLDEGASWPTRRGVSTPASEEQRAQNLEDWRERDDAERENAESSWDEEDE